MKKFVFLFALAVLQGCASTPSEVTYQGEQVGTFGPASGCGTLNLDSDCSQMSGATLAIEIDGTELRIAGGDSGKIVFVMSKPGMFPDEDALSTGAQAVRKFIRSKNIEVLETKVMYGSGKVFGVHYTLNGDAFTHLKTLAL